MALANAALKTDIQDILDGTIPLPTVAAAGVAWGDAIHAYAGTGGVINPGPAELPITGLATGLPALKTALAAAFSSGTPAGVASGMSAAIDAYWAPGVVALATPGMGSTGGAALTATLTAIFAVVGGTHSSKAAEIQAAITVHTGLVVAVFPAPGPPVPGPFPVV